MGAPNTDPAQTPRVAVITGAANGIGLATARLLADRGYRLVLADVEAGRLESAAGELRHRSDVLAVLTDVSEKAQVDRLAEETFDRFGRTDVLFLNAGVAVAGPTVDMSHADWSWLLGVNLWGPIHGVEAFLPRMTGGSHLLFTSSFAGLVPNVGLGPYVVSKYGVVGLAEVLHRELQSAGVGVSVLCPMLVHTDVDSSERNRPGRYGGPGGSHTVPRQSAADSWIQGRILSAETVAEAVVAAIGTSRLYVLTHEESRPMIRRRFEKIDAAFDQVPLSEAEA